MRYILIAFLAIGLIACEEAATTAQDTIDEIVEEPAEDPVTEEPETEWVYTDLDSLYDDPDYEVYTSECAADDHNCDEEKFVHDLTEFNECEAVAQWEYGSGERWVIPRHEPHFETDYQFVVIEDNDE